MALDLETLQELARNSENRTISEEPVPGHIEYQDGFKVPVMVITLDTGEEGGVTTTDYPILLAETAANNGIVPSDWKLTRNGYWKKIAMSNAHAEIVCDTRNIKTAYNVKIDQDASMSKAHTLTGANDKNSEKKNIRLMKLFLPFKKLPMGYYRLSIAGWIVLPIVVAAYTYSHTNQTWLRFDHMVSAYLISVLSYYVLCVLGIWVYLGFKETGSKL